MSRRCNCSTSWATSIYLCSSCYKLTDFHKESIQIEIDKFINEVTSELNGKVKGQIMLEVFPSSLPPVPGTSGSNSVWMSRYCTSSDWFAYRNLIFTTTLNGRQIKEVFNTPIDCIGIIDCEFGTWLGYWTLLDKTCDCVGPSPGAPDTDQYSGLLTAISEQPDFNNQKNVPGSLALKAEWVEQSGRVCGTAVRDPETPPQPPPPSTLKTKYSYKLVNLVYTKFITKWQMNIKEYVYHNC